MKIAVVGCGAVGSFYGATLARAGETVHFILRSDYELIRRRGVTIRSRDGDFHVQPKVARHSAEVGVSDLILIGLKTTANDQFAQLLPPLLGPATAVLTLQNGLGNEQALANFIPPERILGGLAFVCINRLAPGLIHHIDHGRIVLGEFDRWPEPRTHDLASLFRRAGVPCEVTDNLARSHWEKLAWNIPFNGLGVASAAGYEAVLSGALPGDEALKPCLTTDQLLADPRWATLAEQLMRETIESARALGLEVPVTLVDTHLARTRTMGAYRPSTLIDFERGQALELESMFLRPWRAAQQAGVHVPRLRALCQVLTQLDAASVVPQRDATISATR